MKKNTVKISIKNGIEDELIRVVKEQKKPLVFNQVLDVSSEFLKAKDILVQELDKRSVLAVMAKRKELTLEEQGYSLKKKCMSFEKEFASAQILQDHFGYVYPTISQERGFLVTSNIECLYEIHEEFSITNSWEEVERMVEWVEQATNIEGICRGEIPTLKLEADNSLSKVIIDIRRNEASLANVVLSYKNVLRELASKYTLEISCYNKKGKIVTFFTTLQNEVLNVLFEKAWLNEFRELQEANYDLGYILLMDISRMWGTTNNNVSELYYIPIMGITDVKIIEK